MGNFTFVPVWVIQDMIVFIAAIITILYIVKNESRPAPILLEFFAFIFLYAAVYENLATVMGWYGYGKSVAMVFNVPLSVPVFEYLIVYSSLKMLETMKLPAWSKPILVGVFGMLADFSLDPVAVKQIFSTAEATIGRWTWYPGMLDVQIYGEPVYNFTGWVILCGYAAIFLMLGRWWYKKTNFKPLVGYLYPVLAMVVSLMVMLSPVSQFLLWLAPFFKKGSIAEWVMMGFFFALAAFILVFFWRGRMVGVLNVKKDFPVLLSLAGFPVVNIVFCMIGGFWQVLGLVIAASLVPLLLVWLIISRGKHVFRINNPAEPAGERIVL